MGFNLRRMFTPPSSWDSFKRGTLAPIIREGATGVGFLVGGPQGAAVGRTLGDVVGRAAAGDNLQRENLGSLGGRAIGQAALGYGMGAGARALGNLGGAFNAAREGGQGLGSSLKSAFTGGGSSAPNAGSMVSRAADLNVPASELVDRPSMLARIGRGIADNPLAVAGVAQGALSAQAQADAADIQRERLDLERAQVEDDLARRRRLREQYQPMREDILRRLLGGAGL